jgi:hypothetical protein
MVEKWEEKTMEMVGEMEIWEDEAMEGKKDVERWWSLW